MPVESAKVTSSRSDQGYILVMLLALITAMGIFLTMALPRVATDIQRDQEAELIFRGEAIARAIRLYKAKTGGYPLSLEDLTKIRPRIIRKLYLDPMTHDGAHEGEWDLITAVQPGASGDTTGLPIVGVKSHSQKDSFAVYHDKTLISDWTFSAADNLLAIPGAAAATGLLPALTGQTGTATPGLTGTALPGQTTTAPPAAGKTGTSEGLDLSAIPQGVAPTQGPPPAQPPPAPPQPQN